ncbi:hypothetical protein P879_11128 [Paragonimus westermani]|uniref:Uncharacterized protein n=1 Tax=Paragonimus westermani TaxID=34504 RepID=A0A8T0DEQ3_9TREM|nr:hypothetical protein P879_11128 [Paragonimus westermani]
MNRPPCVHSCSHYHHITSSQAPCDLGWIERFFPIMEPSSDFTLASFQCEFTMRRLLSPQLINVTNKYCCRRLFRFPVLFADNTFLSRRVFDKM